mmetsp:Transcript_18667/g.13534  ORF Transcript_18667/g.13534 Transcript_18667/m.13534 type:complete len:88 (+) Transcript_18667:1606-1869(+)
MLATLLLNVMLLNMLVTIISETYVRIQQDYKVYIYIDLLHVINQNQFMYNGHKVGWPKYDSKYVFFGEPVDESLTEPILAKLGEIEE